MDGWCEWWDVGCGLGGGKGGWVVGGWEGGRDVRWWVGVVVHGGGCSLS